MRSFKDYDEETGLDEGLRNKFSAITRKVWRSISNLLSKMKFGQKIRIPLITSISHLTEGLLLEFGWSGSHYGKYAEIVAVYELLLRLDREGFNVYKTDIQIAKSKMIEKQNQMAEDISAAKKTGRAKKRDPKKLPAVIDDKVIQNHRGHLKRLALQGKSLADRTFFEITSHPNSLFSEYRTEWSKSKVKGKFGRVKVYQDGASADTKTDTADLVVERYSKDKSKKDAQRSIGFSLKTEATLDRSNTGKSETGGTGFNVWNILSRALAWDVKEINIKDARALPGLVNDPEQSELIFKHYGIKVTDHVSRFIEIKKKVDTWNAEARIDPTKSEKKWYMEYERDAARENNDNWMLVYNKSLKNPKLKNAMIESLRKSLDIAYRQQGKSQSAVLLATHWEQETGQIKTFTNVTPEMDELFSIKNEDLDYIIEPHGSQKTKITFVYKGDKPLRFWSGTITKYEDGRGFSGSSGAEQTHVENIQIDMSTGKYKTKIEKEIADIENKRIQAYYSIEKYIQQKGWNAVKYTSSGKVKGTRTGNLPKLADIKEYSPSVTAKEYDFDNKNIRFSEIIDVVAGLSVLDSTPVSPEQAFRPYEKVLNDYAKKKKSVKEDHCSGFKDFIT